MKEVKLKSDIFVDTLSFSIGKIHRNKNRFLAEIFLWGMFTSFIHKVVPQNNLNNFATLSSGSAAIQNPCIYRHHIF